MRSRVSGSGRGRAPGVSTWRTVALSAASAVLATAALVGAAQPARATGGCADPMLLDFNTSLSPGRTVSVPLTRTVGEVTVAWGAAGTAEPVGAGAATDQVQVYPESPGEVSFTFATAGRHTVSVCGTVTWFGDPEGVRHAEKLTAMTSFGSLGTTSLRGAFAGATHLLSVPASLPATITDLSAVFRGAKAFNQNIAGWDVGNVTDLSAAFKDASSFNQPIGGWDVAKVSDLSALFEGASSFDQPLGGWNTATVTDLTATFSSASAFDQPLEGWNTAAVVSMAGTFQGAAAFNQPLGGWDTSKVVTMSSMFSGAAAFNQAIGGWDTGGVTDLSGMFLGDTAFDQELGGWDTSKVEYFGSMFFGATAFNRDIGSWDTGAATDFGSMFENATSFDQNLGGWNTAKAQFMGSMFAGATAFNRDIGSWDTGEVTELGRMFAGATAFNRDIGSWDTGEVTDFGRMFAGATAFNQDIGSWDTGAAQSFSGMFAGASAFDQGLGGWNTAAAHDLSSMFEDATSFNHPIGSWDTSTARSMNAMFRGATAFDQNLGSWDTRNVTDLAHMFQGATGFDQDLGGWRIPGATDLTEMFTGVRLSTAHYDALLTGWGAQSVQSGAHFSGGASTYSCDGLAGRNTLTRTHHWTIRDGGIAVLCRLSPTPTPAIDDVTPTVDQTLTAQPGLWGPGTVALAYQWYRVSPSGRTSTLSGARMSTYQVRPADVGYRLKAKVTGSRSGYPAVTRTSAKTAKVVKALFSVRPQPTLVVVGTARVGKVLTVVPGSYAPAAAKVTYQWYRASNAIPGATRATYRLTRADLAKPVTVRVKASRVGYVTSPGEYADPTGAVEAGLPAPAVPRLTDTTPQVDEELGIVTAVCPAEATGAVTYQWYRGTSPIAGSTAETYRVMSGDLGARITVTVTCSATDFVPVSRSSAASTPVAKALFAAKGEVAILGIAGVGQPLTADEGTWNPLPDRYAYQWYRNGTAISGKTSRTYQPGRSGTYTVKVTAKRAGYHDASVISPGVTVPR